MKRIEPKDELIIQNKIDRSLSAEEEERFNKLIATSSMARKFYADLLTLQQSLESDSKRIPLVDFSTKIMSEVKGKQIQLKPEIHKSQFRILPFRTNFLAYAAILLIGLVIGSMATYLATSTHQIADERQFSGTISSLPALNFDYYQDGTQIKVQELLTPEVKIMTVFIHTEETIQCRISGSNARITDKNITLQFAEGKFLFVESGKEALQYSCSGSIVFQIKETTQTDPSNKLSLQFSKNNLIIKQIIQN